MRALMESVEVEPGEGGTTVRMRRRLEPRAGDAPRAGPASPPIGPPADEPPVAGEPVRLDGDLDEAAVPALGSRLRAIAAERGDVMRLDLTEVRHVGSAGVRMLVELDARPAAERRPARGRRAPGDDGPAGHRPDARGHPARARRRPSRDGARRSAPPHARAVARNPPRARPVCRGAAGGNGEAWRRPEAPYAATIASVVSSTCASTRRSTSRRSPPGSASPRFASRGSSPARSTPSARRPRACERPGDHHHAARAGRPDEQRPARPGAAARRRRPRGQHRSARRWSSSTRSASARSCRPTGCCGSARRGRASWSRRTARSSGCCS